ncbi:hypothetical protein FGO68_gene1665 [Halteria grandinella]|uniref:TLDc domain-containing protein n=1 Tax=Halteria grandinella TaxID=5974 RepID=A0A8J8P3I3_HALGN|nr:hypothetical protein FGO68_gene1665 [Halteria grandinella]
MRNWRQSKFCAFDEFFNQNYQQRNSFTKLYKGRSSLINYYQMQNIEQELSSHTHPELSLKGDCQRQTRKVSKCNLWTIGILALQIQIALILITQFALLTKVADQDNSIQVGLNNEFHTKGRFLGSSSQQSSSVDMTTLNISMTKLWTNVSSSISTLQLKMQQLSTDMNALSLSVKNLGLNISSSVSQSKNDNTNNDCTSAIKSLNQTFIPKIDKLQQNQTSSINTLISSLSQLQSKLDQTSAEIKLTTADSSLNLTKIYRYVTYIKNDTQWIQNQTWLSKICPSNSATSPIDQSKVLADINTNLQSMNNTVSSNIRSVKASIDTLKQAQNQSFEVIKANSLAQSNSILLQLSDLKTLNQNASSKLALNISDLKASIQSSASASASTLEQIMNNSALLLQDTSKIKSTCANLPRVFNSSSTCNCNNSTLNNTTSPSPLGSLLENNLATIKSFTGANAKFTQVFNAKKDGFNMTKFYDSAGAAEPILLIMKNQLGQVFGHCSSLKWNYNTTGVVYGHDRYPTDPGAYIFSVTKQTKIPAQDYIKELGWKKGGLARGYLDPTYTSISIGFYNEPALKVSDYNSTAFSGRTASMDINGKSWDYDYSCCASDNADRSVYIAGAQTFQIAEFEAYQVQFS